MERTIIIVCAEDEEDLDVEQSWFCFLAHGKIGAGETREENRKIRGKEKIVGKWPTGRQIPSLVSF